MLLREAARPEITYPDNYPVSQKKQDILKQYVISQVVIVAGETGSGKTTEFTENLYGAGARYKGLIGHTPRVGRWRQERWRTVLRKSSNGAGRLHRLQSAFQRSR